MTDYYESLRQEYSQFKAGTLACYGGIQVDDEYLECDQVAKERIQGETDSFGSEWHYLCRSCADDLFEEIRKDELDEEARRQQFPCRLCKREGVKIVLWYDHEDGNAEVWSCSDCRTRIWARERYEACSDRAYDEDCFCGNSSHEQADDDRKAEEADWEETKAECAKREVYHGCWCSASEHKEQDWLTCSRFDGPCFCDEHYEDETGDTLRGHKAKADA
jgi:hypothetical protein